MQFFNVELIDLINWNHLSVNEPIEDTYISRVQFSLLLKESRLRSSLNFCSLNFDLFLLSIF